MKHLITLGVSIFSFLNWPDSMCKPSSIAFWFFVWSIFVFVLTVFLVFQYLEYKKSNKQNGNKGMDLERTNGIFGLDKWQSIG
jgi:hypothetical protein